MTKKTFIIGEIGLNANGRMDLTKMLIKGAWQAGCSAVKFQKRIIEDTYTEEFLNSPRLDNNPYGLKTQREQKEFLEYSLEDYKEIDAYCRELGIMWSASAWSESAFMFLKQFDLKFHKVASSMLNNEKFLDLVARDGKYTYISTGMSSFEQIKKAVDIFEKYDTPYQLLHCNSSYPAFNKDSALPMIDILRMMFNCPIGYSCHCAGRIVALGAVARGAVTIEKHIGFDRDAKTYELIKDHLVETKVKEYNPETGEYDEVIKTLPYGSDQWASITLSEMKKLVIDIRQLEQALELNIIKNFSDAELEVMKKLRG